ncbi:MAG: L,D-transpeptidase family protein [Candidatus Omnitrophota bacterium]
MRKRIILIGIIILVLISGLIVMNLSKRYPAMQYTKDNKMGSSTELVSQAKNFEIKGDIPAARSAYKELINNFSSSNEVMDWQKKLENLNIKLIFSPEVTPKSTAYEIVPGDRLIKIAKKFNTTVELIKKSNNLSGDKIFPGKKLKIYTGVLSILVDKSQNILMLKSNEEIIKTYIVSTGTNNSTPVGTFKVVNKLKNPTWFKSGAVISSGSKENVLGTRWMGFDLAGYGIHGTVEPENLGKQVTQGCVRMENSEVEELYTMIPVSTEVTIVD